jgi:glycosyltransferase involved in cell wall biosynthesis
MVDFNMTKVILIILCREQIKIGLEIQIVYFKGLPTLKQEFETIGVTVTEISGNLIRQVYRLRKLIKNSRASIIHAHLPQAELTSVLSKGRVPLVISRHNAERFMPGGPIWLSKLLSKFVIKRTNARIAISHHVDSFLSNSGESMEGYPFTTIYYGYNFRSGKKKLRKSNNGTLKLISIGRLVPQKDYVTLFRALSIMKIREISWSLIILGEGPMYEDLKALSRQLNISKEISWVGKTSEVFKYLNEADILVLASVYEGFGLVTLEAMDAQVPVVCSNIPTLQEVLGEQYTGFFNVRNPESLVDVLLYAQANLDKLLAQMQIRKRYFDSIRMAREILKIYEQSKITNPKNY